LHLASLDRKLDPGGIGTMNVLRLTTLFVMVGVVAAKRAIVTLLSGPPGNAEKYVRLLHSFVFSLRNAGYNGEVAVMHTKDFPIIHDKLASVLGVVLIPVDKITIPHNKKNAHYGTMLTKLHIWGLTQYDHVMYYDCDFVFQHNPESAFNECLWSNLCATPDTGMHRFDRSVKPNTYFNGGFLVVRPNKKTYEELLSKKHLAFERPFVEQDLLNDIYKNKWGKLNSRYNLMHCYSLKEVDPKIVAIHEKMWILRKTFPQRHYVWNSPKLQMNYDISEVVVAPPETANEKQKRQKQLQRKTRQPQGLASYSKQEQLEILRRSGLLDHNKGSVRPAGAGATQSVGASASTDPGAVTSAAGTSLTSTGTNTEAAVNVEPPTEHSAATGTPLQQVPHTVLTKPGVGSSAQQYETAKRRYMEHKRQEMLADGMHRTSHDTTSQRQQQLQQQRLREENRAIVSSLRPNNA
jgi:hypothetical protein